MQECRVGKIDLLKLKQIRGNIKGVRKNVNEQFYNCFDTTENFLEFIKNWEHISKQEDMIIFLLRILRTMDKQNILINNKNIYEELFKRSFEAIKLFENPKICEFCFLIITKMCNSTVLIIKTIYLNFDIFLFRSVYVSNLIKNKEIIEILHFLSVSFDILLQDNLFDLLLLDWWRFRFFLKNSINCLMDIAFGMNNSLNEYNNQINDSLDNNNIKDLINIKRLPKNLQLYAIEILLELFVKRPELLFKLRIGLNWLVPTINQSFIDTQSSGSVLGIILINILCKWIDSPIIREFGELKYFIQQLFSPMFSFDSLQDFSHKTELLYSPTIIESCKWSLFNLLSTWPGLFTFFSFNSSNNCQFSLFDYIGSQTFMIKDKIKVCTIDLFCDLLSVPYSKHEFIDQLNNGWEKAFFFYKRIRLPDLFSISLRDDFLLAEIEYLDSQYNNSLIDLLQIHQSIILFAIISEKLPEALIRLILLNPDSSISIKATFLLGDILYLLPKTINFETISINNLVHSIVESFYLNDKMINKENKCLLGNSFLLIDRLNEINTFLNKQLSLESLTLINIFLIVNLDDFRIGKYYSSLINSNNFKTVNELFIKNFSLEYSNLDIDILITKALNFQLFIENNFKKYTEDLLENTDWNIIWRIFSIIDYKIITYQINLITTINKLIPIFKQIINLFLPSNKVFIQNKPTLQIIKCGQYCFQILCLFISVYSNNSQLISDMLLNFVHDFCNQINSDNSESVFSSKNLLFGGSSVYFSILRALSSHNFGQKLIEQTGLGQR